ncbi:HlyD family efflux transporter periplasmic adaptor subunit [Cronbergia sp. UHCC 0137]|uniref:HlyD family efflux transporter periplasmic adaptor subunit n=1 Tax=Cronbergia sp. UHCC 0137 TaxID=3110239 RepID=UPI002B20D521|nr:HlyD family efflux transporter periplasmic adaptor subunit [Cronbergia sp. UHCC 0137]MEA5620118.1 HlyD family efflux transporter periplasmic adaptor subunit [Cronbergia sp. UHCC 0137]
MKLKSNFQSSHHRADLVYGGAATSVKVPPNQPTNLSDRQSPNSLTTGIDVSTISQPAKWSTSLQTVLDQPPSSLPSQMVAGGIIFCIIIGTWANFGQFDEIGKARGQLVPQGETYKVHPVIAGKVANVNVKEGQIVKAGQVLVELDQEIVLNEIERLKQERTAYQIQVSQTENLIEKTSLEAKTRIAINDAVIQGQQANINQVLAKIQSHKVAIAQGKERVSISQALLRQLYTDATAQTERLQRLESLVKQGALSQDQLFQAQQNFSDRQRTITQQTGEIQQNLSESQRLQIDLQQTLADLQRLQAELTQRQAEAKTVQIQSVQSIQQLQVEKTQLQAKVQQTEKLLLEAQTRLRYHTLTAPIAGILLSLNISNSGEVIQTGQNIAELASENAPLILKTTLPTQEAGFIKVGNTAKIKFDAYPFQDYGIIAGKVISISPNTKPDEKLGAIYQVEIELDRNYVKANDQTIKFKPGQTATAEIIIRRRRIADIIFEPLKKLQTDGVNL